MRRSFMFASVLAALVAGVACAASGGDESPEPVAPPPPPSVITDAAEPADAGREATTPKGPATCSDAGWCVTPLPDTDLTMIDIWPFAGRAFAIAQSGTLGVKVLEWVDADRQWTYIDDNTQNEDAFGKYVGRIWAPNETEVYYAVSPGYVYHGKRAAAWTWERRQLPIPMSSPLDYDPAASGSPESAALGVWGTSADDVYAWHANTIFHFQSVDGGAPDWVPEYVGPDDNLAVRVFVLSAGGTSKDDVWFGGGRGNGVGASCPLVLRKTPEGYRYVVDGAFSYGDFGAQCDAQPGALLIDGKAGNMTDVQPEGAGRILGLRFPDAVTRLVPDDDGGYAATSTTFPGPTPYERVTFHSLWGNGKGDSDETWLCGPGLIVHGPLTGDAGAYGISTVVLTGAPLDKPLYRVRGTSNTNLWAIGARYAFHKTTP